MVKEIWFPFLIPWSVPIVIHNLDEPIRRFRLQINSLYNFKLAVVACMSVHLVCAHAYACKFANKIFACLQKHMRKHDVPACISSHQNEMDISSALVLMHYAGLGLCVIIDRVTSKICINVTANLKSYALWQIMFVTHGQEHYNQIACNNGSLRGYLANKIYDYQLL